MAFNDSFLHPFLFPLLVILTVLPYRFYNVFVHNDTKVIRSRDLCEMIGSQYFTQETDLKKNQMKKATKRFFFLVFAVKKKQKLEQKKSNAEKRTSKI